MTGVEQELPPDWVRLETRLHALTRSKDNNNWNMHLIGSTFVDVKILQGLNFKSTMGGTFDNGYWMYLLL